MKRRRHSRRPVIRFFARFQGPGRVDTEGWGQIFKLQGKALDLILRKKIAWPELSRDGAKEPKALSHAEVARRARLLEAAADSATGIQALFEIAKKGDEEAIDRLRKIAETTGLMIAGLETCHPAVCRRIARSQVFWPVLAQREIGWDEETAQRLEKLELSNDAGYVRCRFRKTRGKDDNHPARQWAKAAVRTIEQTRGFLTIYACYKTAFNYLILAEEYKKRRSPDWVLAAVRLPALTQETCPQWARVIRAVIREQMPDFHLQPEWKNQRSNARAAGLDRKGEIQNAILDDICDALKTVAPGNPTPDPAAGIRSPK